MLGMITDAAVVLILAPKVEGNRQDSSMIVTSFRVLFKTDFSSYDG